MKTFPRMTCAIAATLVLSLPVAAQQSGPPLQTGETATAYAQRVDACGGARLLGAQFTQGKQFVRARCASVGLTMGAPGGAVAAAGAAVILLAVLASDSSSTTTSN